MNDSDQHGQELARRSYEFSILNAVARTLNGSVDLRSLLESALAKVAGLLGLHTAWILLLDEASGKPYLAAAQNLPSGFHREPEQMAGWCYCLEAFCAGNLSGAENVGVITCSRLHKLALAQGDTAGLRGWPASADSSPPEAACGWSRTRRRLYFSTGCLLTIRVARKLLS